MTVDKKWIIERQGKEMVLYEGLLNQAHAEGLCRISTTLIQVPHPDNGNVAIVHAEVEVTKGSFSGIGDASSGNVGKPIIPHIIRMAETRAKARAMRDAVNIGMIAADEISGNEDAVHTTDDGRPVDTRSGEIKDRPAATPPAASHKPANQPPGPNGDKPATSAEIANTKVMLGEAARQLNEEGSDVLQRGLTTLKIDTHGKGWLGLSTNDCVSLTMWLRQQRDGVKA